MQHLVDMGVLPADANDFQTSMNTHYEVYSYRFRYQREKTEKHVDCYIKVETLEESIVWRK